ncbi:HAD hydrolase-like protein [Cohaesibacter celericrescens]|uniref:HAD hydrolase-like protein n=1 Tax=Cohaesibacter celericrescens TaxID=2067669 RepID=UPI001FE1070B|nr:HAD hydrolase-like protein [Cohaesibacter celericrescens]
MAIFFDLDGTLTDPKLGIVGSIRYALDALDVADQPDDLDWCIGPPLQESFAKMVGPERMEEAIAAYRQRYSTVGLFENTVYDGIPALLTDLKSRGIALYVATSKPRLYANEILEHFELAPFFSGIFGAEMDGTRGNKAELLSYALKMSGETADLSLMIGDRKYDILGGKANQMKTLGVLWGYGDRAELELAGADLIVDDLKALADRLKSSE